MSWLSQRGRWIRNLLCGTTPRNALSIEQWIISHLPDEYRMAVWLHYGEGMSCSEVSEALSIPEAGIHGRLRDGLRILQSQFTKLAIPRCAQTVAQDLGNGMPHAPRHLLRNLQNLARLSPNSINNRSPSAWRDYGIPG